MEAELGRVWGEGSKGGKRGQVWVGAGCCLFVFVRAHQSQSRETFSVISN